MRKTIEAGKVCESCGATLIRPKAAHFCDYCKDRIPEGVNIEVTVFWTEGGTTDRNEFCSWRCYMDWIRGLTLNKKMINFITPPYLGGSNKEFSDEYDAFIQSLTSRAKENVVV